MKILGNLSLEKSKVIIVFLLSNKILEKKDAEEVEEEEYSDSFSSRYWMNFLLWLFYLPEFVCSIFSLLLIYFPSTQKCFLLGIVGSL